VRKRPDRLVVHHSDFLQRRFEAMHELTPRGGINQGWFSAVIKTHFFEPEDGRR